MRRARVITPSEQMEKGEAYLDEFSFGLFGDVPEGVTHPLLIDEFEDEAESKRKLKVANIYKLENGSTQLHQAIRARKELLIKLMIEAYHEDFGKVQNYLEKKYQWDQADPIWLKKTILVANREEECRAAKVLETKIIKPENLRKAIFVLLQYPVDDEEVAIIHPNESSTRLSAVQLINRLIPNGFLSWNYFEPEGKHQTFMEAASEQGLHDVIDRLLELGAAIAIPDHNPLITACEASKTDTIRWLLTKHFDNFDCTLRNRHHENALIMAMQKNDPKAFVLCLEKMIAYRCKYYQETESEAFNNVFRFANKEVATMSIINYYHKGTVVCGSVDRAIARYGLDLSYQWRDVTILVSMLSQCVALDYCYEGIRKNPELLGIVVYGSKTVLHEAIRLQHTEFLCEMYLRNPEVKEYFNNQAGYDTFMIALYNKNHEIVQFIVEHHMNFLRSDQRRLKDIVCICGCSREHYEQHYQIFMKYLPELKEDIERTKEQAHSEKNLSLTDIERSFVDVGIDVSSIDDMPQSLSSLRGSKGATLLHYAVENDNQERYLKLIESGCNVDVLDNEGNHSIHLVQSIAMLDLILDRHPDGRKLVQLTNQNGFSVLHKICSLQTEDETLLSMLEMLLGLGADVNRLTNEGESIVFFLTSCAALEVLRKYSVPLDTVTKSGETALLRHLQQGNNSIAKALLKHVHQLPTFKDHARKYLEPMLGRSRYFLEQYTATTRLIFDTQYKHSRKEASRIFNKASTIADNFVLEKFLEFDYDLDYNCQDEYQNTPIIGLFRYIEEPNKHIVEQLLKKDVDLNIKNKWGQDALLVLVERFKTASWYGHDIGTVQLLLDHGAAVNTTNDDGNTPLHLAFKDGIGELLEVLIRNGADVGIKNKEGKVPLQLASAVNQELFYFVT